MHGEKNDGGGGGQNGPPMELGLMQWSGNPLF